MLVVAAPVGSRQPETPALSVPQFVAAIDLLLGRIDAADSPDARSAVIASMPPRWRIVDGRQEFLFSTAGVSALLRPTLTDPSTWSATRQAVRLRLTAIRNEVVTSADAPVHPPHAREALTRVLSRQEFQRSTASRWREDLQRLVGEWIEGFLARIGGGPGAGRRVGIALAWIASLGALAALGFWIVRSIAQHRPGASLGLGDAGTRTVRARELALRSLAAARAGDVREAVRIAYHAALVRLEEQGVWRVDDARTPREYVTLVRPTDGRHAPLIALTRRFEQVWYGNQPAAAGDAADVRAHLEELGCLRPGEQAT
jgi:hypothetical protein